MAAEQPSSFDLSQRLPFRYFSPEKTVSAVGGQPLPADTTREPVPRRPRQRSRSGPVAELTVDPRVLRLARSLAEQAMGRLVYLQDGSIIVANSPQHARYMREDPTFDTFNGSS